MMADEVTGSGRARSSRRGFLRGAAAAAAGSTAAALAGTNFAFAEGSDQIKIGLVGCGGRGTGAAADALQADPGIHLTALGDVFKPQVERSLRNLKALQGLGSRVDVSEANQFVGLDAY